MIVIASEMSSWSAQWPEFSLYVYIYIYTYTYIKFHFMCIYVCIYIYVYIYMYILGRTYIVSEMF